MEQITDCGSAQLSSLKAGNVGAAFYYIKHELFFPFIALLQDLLFVVRTLFLNTLNYLENVQ